MSAVVYRVLALSIQYTTTTTTIIIIKRFRKKNFTKCIHTNNAQKLTEVIDIGEDLAGLLGDAW